MPPYRGYSPLSPVSLAEYLRLTHMSLFEYGCERRFIIPLGGGCMIVVATDECMKWVASGYLARGERAMFEKPIRVKAFYVCLREHPCWSSVPRASVAQAVIAKFLRSAVNEVNYPSDPRCFLSVSAANTAVAGAFLGPSTSWCGMPQIPPIPSGRAVLCFGSPLFVGRPCGLGTQRDVAVSAGSKAFSYAPVSATGSSNVH